MMSWSKNRIDRNGITPPTKSVDEMWLVEYDKGGGHGTTQAIKGYVEKTAKRLGFEIRYIPYKEICGDFDGNGTFEDINRTYCDALTDYVRQKGAAPKALYFPSMFNFYHFSESSLKDTIGCEPYFLKHYDDALIAAHTLTPEKLEAARANADPDWKRGNEKLVLITIPKTCDCVEQIVNALPDNQDIGLLVTSSPRTSKGAYGNFMNELEEQLSVQGKKRIRVSDVFDYEHEKDRRQNPYLSMLASADAIVNIAESRSMASEAMLTGKPIYTTYGAIDWQKRLRDIDPEYGHMHDLPEMESDARIDFGLSSPPFDTTAPFVEAAVAEYYEHSKKIVSTAMR